MKNNILKVEKIYNNKIRIRKKKDQNPELNNLHL